MSSHHIIREKQEPALLVLGLATFPDELFGQLLEWSPTVIVNPYTAEHLHTLGIKYDTLIGDGTGDLQEDIKYIKLGPGGEVVSAMEYLAANGYPAVNVVTDELELSDYFPYTAKINIVIFHNLQKIYPVSNGFSKWKPAGDVIRIVGEAINLHTNGLEKIDDNEYKTIADGFITLQFDNPFLFISEGIT